MNEKPRTGVEIMDVMEANLQGWWRPSPGSIYPLLDSLVKEGVLARSGDKHYSLTQLGREEFERPFPFMKGMPSTTPRSVEDVLGELSSYVSYLEDIAQAKDGRLVKSAPMIAELGDRLHKLGESA